MSNRKYQPFPLSYFSMAVCLQLLFHHMLSIHIYPGKAGFCFFITVQSFNVRKWSGISWPDESIRSFAHFSTSLSSLYRRIWKYWTSKILVSYILSSVCLRSSQCSQLSCMQYMRLCVFSWPIPLVMIVRICVLYRIIIIKLKLWTNCNCLWLGHKTMTCAVCLSMLLSTMIMLLCGFVSVHLYPAWLFHWDRGNNLNKQP